MTTAVFDLHSHSTASDGTLAPAALVTAAAEAGVTVLALTDHDTVDGLPEARKASEAAGIRLLNGVEISTSWHKRTLHIVGLGIDDQNPTLMRGLAQLQATRQARAEHISAKLEKLGVPSALTRASELAQGGQPTRTHFARLLVESGDCKDMKQAFKKYLGAGKPAYVSSQWAELDEVISWIHAAGGVTVLAHPLKYNMTAAWRRRMLTAFKEAGGNGVEVCCGGSNAEQIQTSAREADRHQLLGSVGSDFHHPEQRWIRLGKLAPLPTSIPAIWSHPRIAESLS